MKLGTFLEMYGNWNGKALINDNSMNKIVQDRTINIYEQRKDLLERTVLTFNFYNGIIIIIISNTHLIFSLNLILQNILTVFVMNDKNSCR